MNLLATPNWPSAAQLWRESVAPNPGSVNLDHHITLKEGPTATSLSAPAEKSSLPPPILTTFYRGTIESVLSISIAVWYGNCSMADCKTLERTVNTVSLSHRSLTFSFHDALARPPASDPTHSTYSLFLLLPSDRRYRSIRAHSARLLNSFFPQAVRALNFSHPSPLWNPPAQTPQSLDHIYLCYMFTTPYVQYWFLKTIYLWSHFHSLLNMCTGYYAC